MFFKKDIQPYCLNSNISVHAALKHIEQKKIRLAFCVNSHGRLEGTFSFGDFNRWILREQTPNLDIPISDVMNTSPFFSQIGEVSTDIKDNLEKFKLIPVVDSRMHILGMYQKDYSRNEINFGGYSLSDDSFPFIIAEIGNNHNGSLESAKSLIQLAAEAGAHSAKFQLRDMSSLYGSEINHQSENLGTEYTLDLLKRFQLQNDELKEALEYSMSLGLVPLCTPWDEASVDILESFNVSGYKVASADLTNHKLLRYIASTGKPMLCSTGMATEQEILESVNVLQNNAAQFVLLHCNSTYPAPFKDINLNYLTKLKELSGNLVGYSGHERDINVAIAAVALGAKVIEKHFTVDRMLEGNDHKVSLLPGEFAQMVRGIEQVFEALGETGPRLITQGEMMNRVTLAKSVYAGKDLRVGETINLQDLVIKSPGKGLQPNYINELVSKPVKRSMAAGEVFYPSDLEAETVAPKMDYSFWSKWGIPVRHHDFQKLYERIKCPVLEFHLSYKDLELQVAKYFTSEIPADLIVHAPELFFGDHTLDLTSPDPEYRKHSVNEIIRTIEVVKSMKPYFQNNDQKIGLITNVGGFSHNGPIGTDELNQRTELLKESLKHLENDVADILPQTMPPFPWHFGGQQFHNLFLDGAWIDDFCTETGVKVCLDISHSALYCSNKKYSFAKFLDKVMPHCAHLHLADASGIDAEGLQIGEGTVDWTLVSSKMREHCPNATWIPEIWQGHENSGEGFWISLDRLEKEGF